MKTLDLKEKIKSVDQSSLVDRVEENLIDYLMVNNFTSRRLPTQGNGSCQHIGCEPYRH